MFLVGEERLEGEGAVVRCNAQISAFESKLRAEKGEVGGVTPQSAAGAVL